ncbi:MAG: hypothetical protein IPM77_16465 [Crocinitomicaceae bacterium]|nr:hypothetical protein [Crocinitomicaceae bacterium]
MCIVNQFNGELQLIVRSFNEVQMTGTRCPGQLVLKDFDDNSITSGGWIVQQVTGAGPGQPAQPAVPGTIRNDIKLERNSK